MPGHRTFVVIAILGVLILAAFANSFSAGLVLDSHTLVADSRVHALSLDSLKTIFSTDYWYPAVNGLYRPVTTLSFLFNYALLGNGTNPAGYHWVNFLLHWTNAVLVFLLGIVLFKDRSPAFLSAALFAV